MAASNDRAGHQWDMSAGKHMKIEEDDGTAGLYAGMATVVDPMEAERLVEGLRKFTVEEVGTSAYMEQHAVLEKLNVQAHQSAMSNSDEYVLEALMTFEKLPVLINDLIVIEAWKEFVYPRLLDRVAGRNTMRTYFIMYHEATVVNLLEVLLYHKHINQAVGEQMIEMIDYCSRKLTRLNGGYNFRAIEPRPTVGQDGNDKTPSQHAEELSSRTPKEELAQYLTEIEFKVCISAVSLTRFIVEHADALPLSAVSRITDTHGMLILIIPLI